MNIEDKLEALKDLVLYMADKVTSNSIEDYENLLKLIDNVKEQFPEKPSDSL